MNSEKNFCAIGSKGSQALQASATLSDIILEKFLAGILPQSKQISMTELNEITAYNYYGLRKYLGNNYYRVEGKNIIVIADNRYLSKYSKTLCKRLILKLVIPSNFDEEIFKTRVERYIIDTDYTAAETEFIDLMVNEFLSVASIKEFPRHISESDLFDFNSLNQNSFYDSAKKVYNGILQSKLHAGDNISSYLAGFESAELSEKGSRFDFFFDKDGILKCDLNTNKNVLIKNFINSVIYSFNDPLSRAELLQKLNSKDPVLII